MAFRALPPPHIMDKPSWDKERLLPLASQHTCTLPVVWDGGLSVSTARQSFSRWTAQPHSVHTVGITTLISQLRCRVAKRDESDDNSGAAEAGGGSPGHTSELSAGEQTCHLQQGAGGSSGCPFRLSWILPAVRADRGGGTERAHTGHRAGQGPQLSLPDPTPLSPSPHPGLPRVQGILGKFFPEINLFQATEFLFIHLFTRSAGIY